MRPVCLATLLALASLSTARADAPRAPAAPINCPQATEVSEEARELLASRRFDQAITAYRAVYIACSARTIRAATTFNLGLAYQGRADQARAEGARDQEVADRRRAQAWFRAFLIRIPRGPFAETARAHVASLERDLEGDRRANAERTP